MKLLKSKATTVLILAGLMFNLLAFSTTSVEAQDTSSSSDEAQDSVIIVNTAMLNQAFGYWEQSLHRIGGMFDWETEAYPETGLDR